MSLSLVQLQPLMLHYSPFWKSIMISETLISTRSVYFRCFRWTDIDAVARWLSLCMRGFPRGTPVSSHCPKAGVLA